MLHNRILSVQVGTTTYFNIPGQGFLFFPPHPELKHTAGLNAALCSRPLKSPFPSNVCKRAPKFGWLSASFYRLLIRQDVNLWGIAPFPPSPEFIQCKYGYKTSEAQRRCWIYQHSRFISKLGTVLRWLFNVGFSGNRNISRQWP